MCGPLRGRTSHLSFDPVIFRELERRLEDPHPCPSPKTGKRGTKLPASVFEEGYPE
jgi:hypothetical protein